MRHLLLLLGLCACTHKGSGSTDSTDPAVWASTPWDLVPVTPLSPTLSSISEPRQVFRAAGNDDVYIVNRDGTQVRILTPTWAQPSGRFCVDGVGSADNCTGGTLVTSGLVELSQSPAACLDDIKDTLLLIKNKGAFVETVGTNHAGPSWQTYNRMAIAHSVGKEETDRLDHSCAARAGRVALSGDNDIVFLDENWDVDSRIPLTGGAQRLDWVGDSDWLVAQKDDSSLWVLNTAAGTAQEIAPAGDATAIAVDPDRQILWVARSGGSLVRIPISTDGIGTLETMSFCGQISQLAVDSRTGAAYALSDCADDTGDHKLLVVDRDGLRAQVSLDDDHVLALVPPGAMGELAALVQNDSGQDTAGTDIGTQTLVRAWAVVDPDDDRPPLSMFVVTTLEQPFTNATMACTRDESPSNNFESYVAQLQENIPVLQGIGMPVAVGVTWEFATKARECGLDGVLTDLYDAGFTLGTMVHDKPCYSCTDGDVDGETPDTCTPADPDWADPDDADACWPSDENYCGLGDNDCWATWVGSRALDVDQWIPGGSQFIFGADRHRLWGWEYINHGYRSFPRADGGTGYTISMFGGAWVYSDITDPEDPRAKDPAPWTPELLGNTWFPADVEDWEQDSAFSDLLYMPGNSNALSRIYEGELSDLSLVHLIEEFDSLTVTQEDTDTLLAKIMQPVAHRSHRPGTYYFHLADLTGYPLKPDEGDPRIDQQALLLDFKSQVEATYGDGGLGVLQWRGPLDVRADVDDWMSQQ